MLSINCSILEIPAGLCDRNGQPATDPLWAHGLPYRPCAWIIDHDTKSEELIERVFAGGTEGLSKDDILDNISLYWFTKTAISSAQLYF